MEFDRKIYPYTRESLVEWKQDTLMSVENYINALATASFPKHTAWCMGKYGKCQYHTVCTLPSNQRQFMLNAQTEFENVTWSPLHDTTNLVSDDQSTPTSA
jgi:Sec7-like guanine-nucleotide exchange factor